MFDNIGGKLKTLAITLTVLGILGSIIGGGIICSDDDIVGIGIAVMIVGSLLSWVSSMAIYGFGELIETATLMQSDLHKILAKVNPKAMAPSFEKSEVKQDNDYRAENFFVSSDETRAEAPLEAVDDDMTEDEYQAMQNPKIPVKPIDAGNGMVICPACGTKQKDDRYVCFHCGKVFINGQPGIPYFCEKCGKAGPFTGPFCPDCGSVVRIENTK